MKRSSSVVIKSEKRPKVDLSYGLYSVRLGGFLDIIKEMPKNRKLMFTPKKQFYPRLAGLGVFEEGEDQLLLKSIDGETPVKTLSQIHMAEIDFKTDIEWEMEESAELVESDDDSAEDDDSHSPENSSNDDSDEDYEEVSIDKFISRITDDVGYHSVPPLKMKFKLDRERKCAALLSLTYDLKEH